MAFKDAKCVLKAKVAASMRFVLSFQKYDGASDISCLPEH
jgi:hypothetical protein